MHNFKYFALMYLNDWYDRDKAFVEGLENSDKSKRLAALQDAAKYYKVVRNFPTLNNEIGTDRLKKALRSIDNINSKITPNNVNKIVNQLSDSFNTVYGSNNISAA